MVLGLVLVGIGQWSWAGCCWELANGLGLGAGGNWPMVLGWVLLGIGQWSWAGCWWELATGLGLGAGGELASGLWLGAGGNCSIGRWSWAGCWWELFSWPMVLGWVLVGTVQLANGLGKSAERAGSGRLWLEAWP